MITGAYDLGIAITPSDTVDIAQYKVHGPTHAVYVGGAGVVVAVLPDDSTVSLTAVAGEWLPIAVKRINSGSTTATLLIAWWQV